MQRLCADGQVDVSDSSPILTEADTCRELVTPALQLAGWGQAPYAIGEQHQIIDGRLVLIGSKARRAKQRRADYLLYYRCDFPIAVVEAVVEAVVDLQASVSVLKARHAAIRADNATLLPSALERILVQ